MSTQPTAFAAAPRIPSAGRGGPLSRPCENCGARAGEKCFWYCTARPTKAANNAAPHTSTAHRSAALLLTVSALGAGITGCSSTAPHTSATPFRATHTATPPASSPARAWTGARLDQLLPNAGMFVAGITVTRASNTGISWIDPAHLPSPALPTAGCANTAGISAGMFTADYQAAAATETLNVDGATTVLVVLEATNPGGAAQQIAEDTAYAQRCASTGLALDSFAGLGDQAVRIRSDNPTDPDVPEVELARVGDLLAAVCDTDLARDESVTASVADYLAHQLESRSS